MKLISKSFLKYLYIEQMFLLYVTEQEKSENEKYVLECCIIHTIDSLLPRIDESASDVLQETRKRFSDI